MHKDCDDSRKVDTDGTIRTFDCLVNIEPQNIADTYDSGIYNDCKIERRKKGQKKTAKAITNVIYMKIGMKTET